MERETKKVQKVVLHFESNSPLLLLKATFIVSNPRKLSLFRYYLPSLSFYNLSLQYSSQKYHKNLHLLKIVFHLLVIIILLFSSFLQNAGKNSTLL